MNISWIYPGYLVGWLVHNSSIFADATNASSGDTCRQWLLRLRRLEHKVGVKSLFEGKAMFDFLGQVEGGGSGSNGRLPSSVCDAGSLEVKTLHCISSVMFHCSISFISTVPSYSCVGYHWGTPQPYFSRVLPLQWSCPFSSSSRINYFGSLPVAILCPTLRRDHCGVWRIALASLGITGVVVVARPPGLFPPEVIITILICLIFNIINSIISSSR